MSELRKNVSMGFTKGLFSEGMHICMIFDSEEQRRKIISEFLAEGIRKGEQVRYMADVTTPEEVRSWLVEMGVELSEAEKNGSFKILSAESFYCPSGQFEPQTLVNGTASRIDLAKKAGSGVRSTGEMNWVLRGIPGSDRLIEYEALLTDICEAHAFSGICQYDARRFDGATLLNVLKVHPFMIAQGQIVRNPYYMRPEEFLKEFASRQSQTINVQSLDL